MDSKQTMTLTKGDDTYPERLLRLPDPPEQLFLRGRLPEPPYVAIVGSRNADPAACQFTRHISGDLARHGVVVISGGALGIDTAAHRGALQAGGRTISVIGSGFDFLYPEANRELFAEIRATGCLVTEFRHDQPPAKWTFPRRNRLVAALSDVVLVVQAGARSGALITAKLARELDVPVAAVPGTPSDPRNRGNHELLKNGARWVETTADLLALIAHPGPKRQLPLPQIDSRAHLNPTENRGKHSPLEIKILEILCSRPLHIDDITANLGISPSEASTAVLSLELEGLVEDRGGKNYVRVGC
jgi:DNA processing protein